MADRSAKVLEEWKAVASHAAVLPEAPRPRGRSVSLAAPLAALVVVGVVIASGFDGTPGAPLATATFSDVTASPPQAGESQRSSPSELPSATASQTATDTPLPSVGGTCSSAQISIGKSVAGYGYGNATTTTAFLCQELTSTSPSCTIVLPPWIRVLGDGGALDATPATSTTPGISIEMRRNASVTLTFTAGWAAPTAPPAGCERAATNVEEIRLPLADGEIRLNTGIPWKFVCVSQASVSIDLKR